MATITHPLMFINNTMFSYIVSLLIISFFLMNNCNALGGRKLSEREYITFDVKSFQSTSCKPSVEGRMDRPVSLKVTHRYGHCSKPSLINDNKVPSLDEVLAHDQLRVASIQNRHVYNKDAVVDTLGDSKVTIPTKSGIYLGVINYVACVGLGTPVKYVTLTIDTGSSLTWTQCKPCVFCHTQNDPIFDPSASTSYSAATCDSTQCSHLNIQGYIHNCTRKSICLYGTGYGDTSFTVGILGNERLTLTPNEVFDKFSFGCGEDNQGLFGRTSGILGLGRDYFSLVSQTAPKYGNYFSYCLPSQSGSNGHLTFGKYNGGPSNLVYTPLVNDPRGEFYKVNIAAIIVGGTQLAINPSVFGAGGIIVDSGTTITFLPPTAYIALRDAFKQRMSQYRTVPSTGACYDFSNQTIITIPKISFIFAGNARVDSSPFGTFLSRGNSIFCLAVAPTNSDSNTGIFGNLMQQTLEVAYDIAGGRIGFGPGGCS